MPNHRSELGSGTIVNMDAAEAARMDQRLGPEIKALRRIRKLTLEQVSGRTGLSVGFISQIEHGKNRPSVSAMFKLSRALGVPINWFFFPRGEDDPAGERHVVRSDQRRSIEFNDGIRDELLTPNLAGRLELLSCIFAPGSGVDTAYTHEGEEAGVVVSGEFELWVADAHYLMSAGDSFSFDSSLPHRYRNPGVEETVVIWAITPPSF